ncbi:hypothetical protein HGRIS_007385 [Hohenbuehelia grisea]|uniref:Mug135-like C-terminal domain-containing protein n=1 Tax=Hohenbuehelia grisea TaxID=104357 RepID=A0ABR3J521_9AGAR
MSEFKEIAELNYGHDRPVDPGCYDNYLVVSGAPIRLLFSNHHPLCTNKMPPKRRAVQDLQDTLTPSLTSALSSALEAALPDLLQGALPDALESSLQTELESCLSTKVDSTLPAALASALSETLRESLPAALQEVDLFEVLESPMSDALRGTLDEVLRDTLPNALQEGITAAMCTSMPQALIESYPAALKTLIETRVEYIVTAKMNPTHIMTAKMYNRAGSVIPYEPVPFLLDGRLPQNYSLPPIRNVNDIRNLSQKALTEYLNVYYPCHRLPDSWSSCRAWLARAIGNTTYIGN